MIFILGAGIVGLTIGNTLVKNGYKVTIFDLSEKSQSSKAAVGMLAPLLEAKPYEQELFELMIESKEKWLSFSKELKAKTNINPHYKENSSLIIAKDSNDHERLLFRKKFFKKIGFEVDLLDRNKTLKLEPLLSHRVYSSLYCVGQDQVNPDYLKKALKKKFIKDGGKIKNHKVEKLIKRKERVGINIDEKEYFASKIILATGSWSRKLLLKSFNVSFPMQPIKGVSLITKSPKGSKLLKHNLWFKNIYIAPRDSGEVSIGATEDEKGFNDSIYVDEINFLLKNLCDSLPFANDFEIIEFRSGLRPSTQDGFPIIGRLENISKNIFCAFGHYRHGILLSPITAEIILSLLKNSKLKDKYKFFSPERFNYKC